MKLYLLVLLLICSVHTHAQLCRPIASSKYTYENGIGTMTDSYYYTYAGNRGAFNIPIGNITYDTCYHIGANMMYVDQNIRSYNAGDTLTFYEYIIWSGGWVPQTKGSSIFDSAGHTMYTFFDLYNQSKNIWLRTDSTYWVYNNNLLDSLIKTTWSSKDTMLVPSNASTYTYDTAGRLKTFTWYRFTNTPWVTDGRELYDYGQGVDTVIQQHYINGQWENYHQSMEYTDSNKNTTLIQQYNWDTTSQKWMLTVQYSYAYNSFNRVTSDTTVSIVSGQSINTWINEYNYNGPLLSDVVSKWFDPVMQKWINKSQTAYSYTLSQLIENVYSRHWDMSTSAWINDSYTGHIYNANDQATSVTEFIGDSALGWQRSRVTYYYYEQFPAGISTHTKLITNLLVYPNPVTDVLYCQLEANGKYNLSVCDVTGRPVLKFSGHDTSVNISIPVQYLPKGMYQLNVETTSENYVTKFIKQ